MGLIEAQTVKRTPFLRPGCLCGSGSPNVIERESQHRISVTGPTRVRRSNGEGIRESLNPGGSSYQRVSNHSIRDAGTLTAPSLPSSFATLCVWRPVARASWADSINKPPSLVKNRMIIRSGKACRLGQMSSDSKQTTRTENAARTRRLPQA